MSDEYVKILAAAILAKAVDDFKHGLSGDFTLNYPEKYCNTRYLLAWFKKPYARSLMDLCGIDYNYFMEEITCVMAG